MRRAGLRVRVVAGHEVQHGDQQQAGSRVVEHGGEGGGIARTEPEFRERRRNYRALEQARPRRETRGGDVADLAGLQQEAGVGPAGPAVHGDDPVALAKADLTLRNLNWFEVSEIRGHIVDGAIRHYQVTMKLGFRLEDEE